MATHDAGQGTTMTPRDLLISGASQLEVSLTSEQLNAFLTYSAELRKWNRKINLTSITNERDIVVKHFLDSLAYLKGFTPAPGMRLLDMGSGAGFPAIPLKLVHPELNVTLVESIKKKASFLRHIIRTLALDMTEVRDMRIEELPESSRKSYDVITARAFADIVSAAASGTGLLKPGGVMILSRGLDESADESALTRIGMPRKARYELVLPHSDIKRALWVLQLAEY